MPTALLHPSARTRLAGPATLAGLTVLFFATPTMLPAQAGPVLEPGTRVRITVPCDGTDTCRLDGRLLRVADGTLTLSAGDSAMQRDLAGIRRIEASRGRRSHWLLGAGVGFVVGAGTTFAVLNTGGSTALCNRDANQDALRSAECLGLYALGGAAGAGLGALVGSLIRTERWEEVPLDRLRVGFRARPGQAVGVAVAVMF